MLSDNTGSSISSIRVLMMFTGISIALVWLFVCIYKREITDIPSGVIFWLSIVLGAKVGQGVFGEKSETQVLPK